MLRQSYNHLPCHLSNVEMLIVCSRALARVGWVSMEDRLASNIFCSLNFIMRVFNFLFRRALTIKRCAVLTAIRKYNEVLACTVAALAVSRQW